MALNALVASLMAIATAQVALAASVNYCTHLLALSTEDTHQLKHHILLEALYGTTAMRDMRLKENRKLNASMIAQWMRPDSLLHLRFANVS